MNPRCYVSANTLDVLKHVGCGAITASVAPTTILALGLYDENQVKEMKALIAKELKLAISVICAYQDEVADEDDVKSTLDGVAQRLKELT